MLGLLRSLSGAPRRDRVSTRVESALRPVAIVSASSRAISRAEGEAGRHHQAVIARHPRRLADHRREIVREGHHTRPGANDANVGQHRHHPDGHRDIARRALPCRRVAARPGLGPGRPAAADDEGAVLRLLQREPSPDVLHHRAEHLLSRLRHVEVQALRADRQARAPRAPPRLPPTRRQR